MFSFHKPKIYRSNLGCCICKAKSSSSRFTDSTKYENEFERCFRIQEKRSGEICNACVLLVKRWKKLSPEGKLTKHWHHVVDARAGPGTKLTGNRRLTSNNCGSETGSASRLHKNKPEVLPLSSSQANNQSGSGSATTFKATRYSSINRARAIDTNVSTFTFGEPARRNYMTGESAYSTISSPVSYKPQSSLNSTAFESVIKRFRQRQQQQQQNAKRREQNKQLRQQRQNSSINNEAKKSSSPPKIVDDKTQHDGVTPDNSKSQLPSRNIEKPVAKRFKHSSESMTSFGSDILRVGTLLDTSIWRKEKVCCGYIFRGLYNEVAIFPKLLKPCQCRLSGRGNVSNSESNEMKKKNERGDLSEQILKRQTDSPPPRATKSGSISSCDSNTSGTGSMEQPLDDIQSIKRAAAATSKNQLGVNRRNLNLGKRQLIDNDNSSSSSGASVTSGNSSSRLILIDGVEDEVEEDELILDEEDTSQSSNDASSSVESLADKTNIAIG